MPTRDQHINQWKRNRKFLLSDSFSEFPEWKIIVAFYCALHAVEVLLSVRNLPKFKDHKGRNDFLALPSNKMLAIWRPNKALFDASHDARYACSDVLRRFAPGVQKELIQSCMQTVEAETLKALQLRREEVPLLEVDATTGTIRLRPEPQLPAAPAI